MRAIFAYRQSLPPVSNEVPSAIEPPQEPAAENAG